MQLPSPAAAPLAYQATKLASAAAVAMLMFLFVPAISIDEPILTLGVGGGASLSGVELLGLAAWASFFCFAVAAVTRFVPAISPYQNFFDFAAFIVISVALCYGLFESPVSLYLQAKSRLDQEIFARNGHVAESGPTAGMAFVDGKIQYVSRPENVYLSSVTPEFGAVLFVVAPVCLYFARRRERVRRVV